MTNCQGPSRSRVQPAAASRAALRYVPITLLALAAATLAAGVPRAAAAADPPATPAAAPSAPAGTEPAAAAPSAPAGTEPAATAASAAALGAPVAPPTPSEIEAARQVAVAAGVTIVDLRAGHGESVRAGAVARVHYTGWLQDTAAPNGKGKKFDSSRDRKQPFEFPLGRQRVIRGWDLGVAGMQRGGRRRLVIPDTLAYGARGAGAGLIPPHATLVFEVELIDFAPP